MKVISLKKKKTLLKSIYLLSNSDSLTTEDRSINQSQKKKGNESCVKETYLFENQITPHSRGRLGSSIYVTWPMMALREAK